MFSSAAALRTNLGALNLQALRSAFCAWCLAFAFVRISDTLASFAGVDANIALVLRLDISYLEYSVCFVSSRECSACYAFEAFVSVPMLLAGVALW